MEDADALARKAAGNEGRWRAQAAAWRHWHPQLAAWWSVTTDLMIARADLRPGLEVLDLASGTGEPALTLAPLVLPGGTVTATDLLPEMLAVAEEQAALQGRANLRCRVADAGNLPFADASFDRVTCRFGVMFFPDASRALREVRRVLRPGGRAVFTAWGPDAEVTCLACVVDVLRRHLPPAPPFPPGFAAPGALVAALREAGLAAEQETVTVALPFPGRPTDYLIWTRGAVLPVEQALGRIPTEQHPAVLAELLAAIARYDDGQHLNFPAPVVLAVATR